MFKKKLSMILGTSLIAIALVACGGSSEGSKETTKEGNNTQTETKTETKTEVKEVTLTVFDGQAYGLDRYEELVQSFEETHPGVNVEVQHASSDGTQILNARINSNDTPDIMALQTGTSASNYYEFAYDWTDDTEVLELFNEDAIKTGLDSDGKVKSLPWTYENMGLIYNKDVFEKSGITELPDTISELEEACIKMEEAGFTAFAIAGKSNFVLSQMATHYLMDKEIDAKGVVDALNSGELTFASAPNFKNYFKVLDLAIKYGPDKPLEVDWEKSENMLANGEAGIMHMGDWAQAMFDKFNPDANLAFLPVPVSENPDETTVLSSISWTYVVNKDSENLDLAKEYLLYILTSEEGLDWICNTIGAVPAAKGNHVVKGALANDAGRYISSGKTNGWIHTLYPLGFSDILAPSIQGYILGNTNVDETIEIIQDAWAN